MGQIGATCVNQESTGGVTRYHPPKRTWTSKNGAMESKKGIFLIFFFNGRVNQKHFQAKALFADTKMDPKRLRALAEYIPKGGARQVRAFGMFGGVLAMLAAPLSVLFYNSLYNGMFSF